MSAYRQTGRKHDLLEDLPIGIFYNIWSWFCELDAARQVSEFGLQRLSYQEIKAWSQLTERKLSPFDVNIIKRLDSLR